MKAERIETTSSEYRAAAEISLCLQNIAQHTGARGLHIWVNG